MLCCGVEMQVGSTQARPPFPLYFSLACAITVLTVTIGSPPSPSSPGSPIPDRARSCLLGLGSAQLSQDQSSGQAQARSVSPVHLQAARPIYTSCSTCSQPLPPAASPAHDIRVVDLGLPPDRTATARLPPPTNTHPPQQLKRIQKGESLRINPNDKGFLLHPPPPATLSGAHHRHHAKLVLAGLTASRRPLRPPLTMKTSRTWELLKLGPGIPTIHTASKELGERSWRRRCTLWTRPEGWVFRPCAVDAAAARYSQLGIECPSYLLWFVRSSL